MKHNEMKPNNAHRKKSGNVTPVSGKTLNESKDVTL